MSSTISALVITNSSDRLQKIERQLIDAGIMYLAAKDSAAAVSILKETSLSVIISDTDIGQLDGWRLARMLRANLFESPSHTPFILLTDTHCEHIAETTAAAFAIDKVISHSQLDSIASTVLEVLEINTQQTNMLSVLIVEDDPDMQS